MSKLQNILRNFAGSSFHGGAPHGETTNEKKSSINRLKDQLNILKRKNKYQLVGTAVVSLALLFLILWLLTNNSNTLDNQKLILGGGGLVAFLAPVFAYTLKLWKENITVDFLLSMADDMDGETVKSIVSTILQKFFSS